MPSSSRKAEGTHSAEKEKKLLRSPGWQKRRIERKKCGHCLGGGKQICSLRPGIALRKEARPSCPIQKVSEGLKTRQEKQNGSNSRKEVGTLTRGSLLTRMPFFTEGGSMASLSRNLLSCGEME